MANTPTLYTSPGSQHCRRVTMLISEAKLNVELKTIDVRPPGMGGENESEEFLQLNPNAKVPVLVGDGGFVLVESNAIMIYLCETNQCHTLLPTDKQKSAAVISWMFWQSAHLSPTADALMVENMLKPLLGQEPDKITIEKLQTEFRRWALVLDKHLQNRDYMVGNSLTCADLSIISALMYTHAAQLPITEFSALNQWVIRMQNRESWKQTEPPPLSPQ